MPIPVVLTYNAREDVERCLESLVRFTPSTVPIVVADDCSTDPHLIESIREIAANQDSTIHLVRQEKNLGFVGNSNFVFTATAPNDVILINSDVMVGPEWYERICDAATSSNLIATVSVLTNYGTMLSVPYRNLPMSELYGALSVEEIARRVATGSQKIRPTITCGVGHCLYVTRRALNRVGLFDPIFGIGYGEEVDFSLRAVSLGFKNICADDVFVFHRGQGSFGSISAERKESGFELVEQRHPWYPDWNYAEMVSEQTPFAASLLIAKASIAGIDVGMNASMLSGAFTGTQRAITESFLPLASHPKVASLSVFVQPDQLENCRAQWSHPKLRFADVTVSQGRVADVMIQPCQFSNYENLNWVLQSAPRFVVFMLDTIAYDNPSYFDHIKDYFVYTDVVEYSLSLTHGVAFLSEFVEREMRAKGLLSSAVPSRVVGAAATTEETNFESSEPPATPFLLFFGQPFLHKSRDFAIEVFMRLRERGFNGELKLAGPTPISGTSVTREQSLIATNPEIANAIVDLGSVSEEQRRQLLRQASLVLYPSTVEGFGIIPLEAANFGTPTLATRQGSLDEVLPVDIPTIDEFDVDDTVAKIESLLSDPEATKAMTASLQRASQHYSWNQVADNFVDLIQDTINAPAPLAARTLDRRLVVNHRFPGIFFAHGGAATPEAGGLRHQVARHPVVNKLFPVGSARRKAAVKTAKSIKRIFSRAESG